MYQHHSSEDPEPSEPVPAGQLLVPVRPGPLGHTARFFRTPLGDRTAVGFTTEQRLTAALGPAHPWIALAEPALRALAEPLGVTTLTVDPQLVAPAPRPLLAALDQTPIRTTGVVPATP
ncbi:SAV_915 family protein [Kitasatospora azatica]|uniref:SAV_915 family protein n=1 Tax=Kitasatospora azatica TaxID=58347 RepID=UPI0005637B8B|nr:SAV_915 family protein [Kitasatospora azatica]